MIQRFLLWLSRELRELKTGREERADEVTDVIVAARSEIREARRTRLAMELQVRTRR